MGRAAQASKSHRRMQLRDLIFDASLLHAQYYALLYQAAAQRGGHDPSRPVPNVPRDTRLAERRLLLALQSIGTPIGDPPEFVPGEPAPFDGRFYVLWPSGGTASLRQKPDFALLEQYVEQQGTTPALSGIKLDLEDWLSSAPKRDVEDPA